MADIINFAAAKRRIEQKRAHEFREDMKAGARLALDWLAIQKAGETFMQYRDSCDLTPCDVEPTS